MSNFALFVDRQATRMDQAVVRDANNVRPVSFPELVIGSSRKFRLTILDGTNGADAISGSASVQPIMSIGSTCAVPTGGTWTFTRGANTTSALAYNISAGDLETAIEGLASVGSGNVSVKALPGNAYQIEYIGTLADTDIDDANASGALLTPSSTATISRVTEGGSGDNEVQIVRLQQVPFVLQASWTSDGTGWTGTLSTGSWEALTALAAQSPLVATMQVMIVLADGSVEKLALQPARILCDVSDPSQFVPAQFPTYLTAAQVNAFFADPTSSASFDKARWLTRLDLPDAMVVEGAGTSAANSIYLRDGDYSGRPLYTLTGGVTDDDSISWQPDDETWQIYSGGDELYVQQQDVLTPDLVTAWAVIEGASPAPTVRRATWPEYIAALLEQNAADYRENLGMLSASATLDFPSIAAQDSEELTITVTGAAVGDAVQLAPPSGIEADLTWCGYVSAGDTVTVRLVNATAGAIDPASATWGVIVTPLS